jgi:hypothetical protein
MKNKLIGIFICMLLIATAIPVIGQVKNISIIRDDNEANPTNNGDKWIKTYGGPGIDYGKMVQLTNDGCYIVAGETWTGFGSSSVNDFWLLKIDAMGNKIWDKTYGFDSYDWCYAVRQTSDDGFILVGTSELEPHDSAIRLIKTDKYGIIEWDKKYFEGTTSGEDVIQTSDGGYAIFAKNNSYQSNYKKFIIRADETGDIIWVKNITDIGLAWCGENIKQTLDGGFIIAGCARGNSGSIGIKLIKLDSDGNFLWDKTFKPEEGGLGFSVQLTNDGGFIICGHFSGGIGYYSGPWLIKTDSEGELIWESKIGASMREFGYSVQQTIDNGYIIAGSYLPLFNRCPLLIKTDSEGQVEWRKTFGYYNGEVYSVQQTTDGGYITVGTAENIINFDLLLIKTDSEGNIGRNRVITNSFLIRLLERFPNMFPMLRHLLRL